MQQPKLYRREPTEIRAIQWTGENLTAVKTFVGNIGAPHERRSAVELRPEGPSDIKLYLFVAANNDWLPIVKGEWIAEDQFGYYPIKDTNGHPTNYTEAGIVNAQNQFQ